MTEEETNNEEEVEETSENEETTSHTNIYSNATSVRSLIKYTGDDADDDLVFLACDNADATVKSKLSKFRIPEPDPNDIPVELKTAANYYAVSDILQSLYSGEERSGNEEAYYIKADELIHNYIDLQLDALAESELKFKSPYGVSQSPDPYQLGILRR